MLKLWQVVLELFVEKAQASGSPDADAPAMVALGSDRGTYRELPAAEKCARAATALFLNGSRERGFPRLVITCCKASDCWAQGGSLVSSTL